MIDLQAMDHGFRGSDRFSSEIDAGMTLPQQTEALARLEYAVSRRHGFALLTGPAGTGKTTLLRQFTTELQRSATTVFVDGCGGGEPDILREFCDELGLGCPQSWPAEAMHAALLDAVRGRCTVGSPVVIIIDHADRLHESAVRVLERLLHAAGTGLTIVAASREAVPAFLADMARDHAEVRIQLSALTPDDTQAVVDAMCQADRRRVGFTPEAVRDIHSLADGDLRQINRLWQLTQNVAALEDRDSIGAEIVDWVASELPE